MTPEDGLVEIGDIIQFPPVHGAGIWLGLVIGDKDGMFNVFVIRNDKFPYQTGKIHQWVKRASWIIISRLE